MQSMMTMINNDVYLKVAKTVTLKVLITRTKIVIMLGVLDVS